MDTEIFATSGVATTLEQDYLAFLVSIDDRTQAIIEDRFCGSSTLADVAKRFDVTRERIRQVEPAARRAFDTLRTTTYPGFARAIDDLRAELGAFACLADERTSEALDHLVREVAVDRRDVLRRMVLTLAGPYDARDGWLVIAGATLPTPSLVFGDRPTLTRADLVDALGGRGLDECQVDDWIATWPAVGIVDDTVLHWGRSVVDRCAAVLAHRGLPATIEEMLEAIPGTFVGRSVRWRVFEDERFVRVSRDRFALAAWDLDAYEGLAPTMARILAEEHGGQAPLATIVDVMVARFDANPASVRAYADAVLFDRHDGMIRLRGKRERITVDADPTPWQVRDGVFAITVDVTHDVLRGSGSPCPVGLATGLGVDPGGRRTFAGPAGDILVSWPMNAFLGASFGSRRTLAEAAGAVDGDQITVEFDVVNGTVTARRIATAAA